MIVRQGHMVLMADMSHMLPGPVRDASWWPLGCLVFYTIATLMLIFWRRK